MSSRLPAEVDVAVLGGGLAGLTLALQIKRRRPGTSVVVLEKRVGEAPVAAFKVGESSMETAGYYFREVLGLGDHLKSRHTLKAGLRFFFSADGNASLARRVERGPAGDGYRRLSSYQIDRGLFENELASRVRAAGVELLEGGRVSDVDLGDTHAVTVELEGDRRTVAARWIADASGRASILKRKLGLAEEVSHTINSSWIRLDGGADLEDWVDDPGWHARMEKAGLRRRSTNHLMGKGYWVWLIQLGTGPISIGVCADPRFHPWGSINTLAGFRDWMRTHEPQVAGAIDDRGEDAVLDFLKVEDFAFGAEQVYSPERWCLTGEAGAFVDPLYSPGSDIISLSNTLVTDLVVRELDGEDIARRTRVFNDTYLKLFNEVLLPTYTDQYQMFGNALVMSAKTSFDDAVRWTMLALRTFKGKWDDLEFLEAHADELERLGRLNIRMQQLFRDWHALDDREWSDAYVSPRTFESLGLRLISLAVPTDEETFERSLEENRDFLEALAVAIFHHAARVLPGGPPDPSIPVNPYAVGLDPERWEADGTLDGAGFSLDEALPRVKGIESIWLDERQARGMDAS